MTDVTRVFISHARPDQEFVEWLKAELRTADDGLDCHLLPWSDSELGPGNWEDELAAQLAASNYMAAVVSQHATVDNHLRQWIRMELFAAKVLEKDLWRRQHMCSFVLRLDDSPVPPELKQKNYIDFRDRQRGLKKLRQYLRSEAAVLRWFFDREEVMEECYRLFQPAPDRCHGMVIYNPTEDSQLGCSWILTQLKAVLPEKLAGLHASQTTVLLFEDRFLESPLAWYFALEETIEELGSQHFQNYVRLRQKYLKVSREVEPKPRRKRMKAPLDPSPARIGGTYGMDIQPQRMPRDRHSKTIVSSARMLDSLEMAQHLTDAMVHDLKNNNMRLVWLLDWPRSAPTGSVTYNWLCKLLYHAYHASHEAAYPWVIVASSRRIQAGVDLSCCVLEPFTRDQIEKYVQRRLPQESPNFWKLMARDIYSYSKGGQPSLIHEAYDYILQDMLNG